MEEFDQPRRQQAVTQALANLRGRGVYPQPAVLVLHERYVRGEIHFEELRALMRARARALVTDRIRTTRGISCPPSGFVFAGWALKTDTQSGGAERESPRARWICTALPGAKPTSRGRGSDEQTAGADSASIPVLR